MSDDMPNTKSRVFRSKSFEQQIAEMQDALTPELVAKLAANAMPECFVVSRELVVALARIATTTKH